MDASKVPPHAVMQWLCDPEGLIQRLCPFLTLGLFSPEIPIYLRSLRASAFRQQSEVPEKQGSIKRLKPVVFLGQLAEYRACPEGHAKANSNSKNEFGAPLP